MVENDSGTYEEYTDSNSWPTDMTFNEDLSGCIDMDGNEIVGALSFSDGKATVKTSSTTYCYLYFDKKVSVASGTAEETISIASSDTDDGLWASTLTNDGYRYVGTDPDNYICFGTDNISTCTSDTDLYMYRIIGIFADSSGNYHYKLIKKEALNTAYAWHSDKTVDIDWGDSDLYNGLNGSYFLSNTTYSYMQNTTWVNKISTWTWIAVNTKSYSSTYGLYYNYNTGQTVYYHESNQLSLLSSTTCIYNTSYSSTSYCQNGEWTTPSAKIGLIYVSDYLLSLGSSALSLTSYSNYSTLKTGWMNLSNNDTASLSTTGITPPSSTEYTIARYGYFNGTDPGYVAISINSNGSCGNLVYDTTSYSIRPVFYLTSDTVITDGDGSSSNPYILQIS